MLRVSQIDNLLFSFHASCLDYLIYLEMRLFCGVSITFCRNIIGCVSSWPCWRRFVCIKSRLSGISRVFFWIVSHLDLLLWSVVSWLDRRRVIRDHLWSYISSIERISVINVAVGTRKQFSTWSYHFRRKGKLLAIQSQRVSIEVLDLLHRSTGVQDVVHSAIHLDNMVCEWHFTQHGVDHAIHYQIVMGVRVACWQVREHGPVVFPNVGEFFERHHHFCLHFHTLFIIALIPNVLTRVKGSPSCVIVHIRDNFLGVGSSLSHDSRKKTSQCWKKNSWVFYQIFI